MTKTRSTKSALISSVLALFLCFTMLLGTTFAWFTDSVTSANNIIKSGTLVVEMYYADGTKAVPADDSADWKNADGVAIYTADQLWEPGYTDAKHIKISNEGSLALKYQLAIVPTGEVSELAEVIDVYLYEIADTDENATQVENRDDLDEAMWVGTLADVISKGIVQGNLAAETDYTTTIVLKMQETAGNEYQDLKIGDDFTIQLLATQYTEESDSFDADYDADAWAPGMLVYNEADLKAALANGGSVTLAADVEVTETIIVPEIDNTTYSLRSTPATVLNLNGYEISYKQASGSVIRNEGNLVITGSGKITSEASSYAIRVQKGSLTIDSATLEVTGVFGAISMFNDAQVTINGGTYTAIGAAGKTHHCIYVGSGADLVINGGTFEHKGAGVSDSGATLTVYAGAEGGVTINGGTFIGSGTYINPVDKYDSDCYLVINGGSFSKDPSKYVADGFKSEKNGDFYYVVAENVSGIIVTPADLAALGGTKINGTYELMADIDMSTTAMKPMEISGGANVVFNGNGYTISNLSLTAANIHGMTGAGNEVAGLFDLSAPATTVSLTVNDLAFENATVACSGYAAVVAGYNSNGSTTITLNNVDVKGATVTAETVAGLVGYTTGVVNMTDCDVSGLALTGEAGRPEKVGALVGTANTETCTVKVDNCTNATSYSDYGRVINGATWKGVIGVNTVVGFQNALDNATDGTTIALRADIAGNVKVTQKADVKITIDGKGKTFNGVMTVFGNGRKATAALTIKNINFVAANGASSCIVSPDRSVNNAYSYSSNVTVENCTFTDPDGVVNCAAVRHEDGGDSNWKIIECVVDSTMHSLIQTNNVELDGLTIQGCKVYSKNGINLNQCTKVSIVDCEIDVKGYAVRYGVSGATVNGTFEIVDSTLKSANDDGDAVIIFRGTMTGSTLTITNTTLVGTPETTGNANVVRN